MSIEKHSEETTSKIPVNLSKTVMGNLQGVGKDKQERYKNIQEEKRI